MKSDQRPKRQTTDTIRSASSPAIVTASKMSQQGVVLVSRRNNVSSRSHLEKKCQRLGLGQLRLVPKTNFGQIVHATLIKRTQCERALDAGGSEALTFSYQISALSKCCCYHIRKFAVFVLILTSKLPVPLPLLSFILNLTTATHCRPTSSVSDKKKLEHPELSCSCCHHRTPKSSHIIPVLKSLHWLKINERITYKLLFLTYKLLTTNQPQYLHNSISVQPCRNTRSSSMVTVARPPTHSSLKITNRSFSELSLRRHRTHTVLQNTIDSCMNSATDRRGGYMQGACCTYRRLPKAAEGHRRLPKADVGDVVRRRQGRIQGGEVHWLRTNPLTPYPQKHRNSAKEI